ncbi:hypothetical protein AB832_06905 [Flavobacteriaceae bacterium (ex Bugula neritina AB1)]|nr:hypothetical protein AB832_06905 [Flavobacteriaceae bacterium (ex Bugula neritina AB1)]
MGRKKITIDWTKVDKALIAGANGVQVASMLGVHPETLYDRCKEKFKTDFSDYSRQKKEKGNLNLLTKQYDLAIEGDRGMLIWLGKQRLGQKDKHDHDHTTNGKDMGVAPITWVDGKD